MPSLMAVFAHPDDESLFAGEVLARHTAAGARTAVVTATWTPDTRRGAELAEALRILGAGEPRMLGYADAKVPQSALGSPRLIEAPLDESVGRLVTHIRQFRPEIVLTHDAYGGITGHLDHAHTHRVTTLAVQAAGLERLYPQAGAPWQPSALYLATHPHSAREVLCELIRAGKAMNTVPDEWITATVDVSPWLKQKWAAVLAHRSEVERGAAPGRLAGFPAAVRERILATEWYIRHDPVASRPVASGPVSPGPPGTELTA
ncbi:putative LmbE family protein [Streptomyces viridochromogenes Tue57]|uniref:Putative LmbE family protein n=1 Tax=Streptomyces viridochromogenes Tue57 TaxID=1160705 RepID=L8PDQ3_STRVR|nr:putative LmbE family protein [Streptomyces viridochromogenes Tue57]